MGRRRIRILPDHVANQIAAGEVVERPASVVKELVENAIDAGAGTIRIEIERGGKGCIRVEDDGEGMMRQDALACLDRHATSKIVRAEDLEDIRTMGFRGEALPSIAAVSRTVIETRAEGDEVGTRVRARHGRMLGCDDIARRRGTAVEVRNLFRNTPVRARFLGAVAAETRAVSEAVHSLALAHPGVRFVLRSRNATVLDLPADRGLRSRIEAIWPDARKQGLIALDARAGDLRLTGAVQRPDLAREGFRRVHLFVNGRPFRDPRVVRAADDGYRTTIPEGARPWLFLFLELPPGAVDVNVHPSKAEVRFREPARIHDSVARGVREALEGLASAATWERPDGAAVVREGAGRTAPPVGDRAAPAAHAASADHGPGHDSDDQLQLSVPDDAPAARDRVRQREPAPAATRPTLLQIHNAFILAETRDGVIILDQHAAHERVLYERIVAGFEGGEAGDGVEGQRLLFPFSVRLSGPEIDLLLSAREEFSRLGFEFSRFGEGAIVVQEVPSPHAYFDAERCLREMIDELLHGSELTRAARSQNERVAMSYACKAAIKAGQRLSLEEMHELFDQLFATELPYHDVHGRPTVVRLGIDELRRKFGR